MNTLEVLRAISNALYRTLQLLESRQSGIELDFFMRSMSIAQILLQMIALTGENKHPTVIDENGNQAPGNQLIISMTKLDKLDQILNQIKLKAISTFNLLIEIIQLQSKEVQDACPVMTMSANLLSSMCIACRQFATSPFLESFIEDTDLSELIVVMIDFLILGTESPNIKNSTFYDQ